jgi:hypothetical protein
MAQPSREESLGKQLEAALQSNWAATKLRIVLLGPGQTNEHFTKRSQIRDHIKDACPQDEVILPEEVISEELRAQFGLGPTEARLVQMADIVLALFPPRLQAPSLFHELMDFATLPGVAEKVRIFRPDDESRFWNGYREDRLVGAYDVSSFVYYPSDSWITCEYIRPHASTIVNEERRRRLQRTLTRKSI